jgi:hypothetical protein
LICYYRFGSVSIIIAYKYYFVGWIDVLFRPLPNETVEDHGKGLLIMMIRQSIKSGEMK